MPDGTEMPAPVSATTGPARADQLGEPRARRRHFPLNSGARFSMNARDALARVLGARTRAGTRRARRPGPSSRSPACETRLICSSATGAWPAQLARPGERGVEQLVVGDDAVDEPVLVGLVGRDRLADRCSSPAPWPARPAARSRCVPPKPGMIPRLISGWPKEAERPARRTSQAIAISQPPPKREAVDGGDRHDRRALPLAPERVDALQVLRGPTSASHFVNALMSAPAQNSAGFGEASTIARAPRADQVVPGAARAPSIDVRRERVGRRVVEPDDRDVAAQVELHRRVLVARPRPADTGRSPGRSWRPAAPGRPAGAGSAAARSARPTRPRPAPARPARRRARARRPARTARAPCRRRASAPRSMSRTPATPSSSTRQASTNAFSVEALGESLVDRRSAQECS